MPLLEWLGVGLLCCVLVVIVLLAVRRVVLVRGGGIDVCWRDRTATPAADGTGWIFGQAKYSADRLLLYRSFSVLPVPARSLARSSFVLGERRAPLGVESDLLPRGAVVVDCRADGSRVAQLAIGEVALTGLLSWIESAPQPREQHRRQNAD